MSSGTETDEPTMRVDVRDVDGEPFGHIVSALESLPPGGDLLLVNSFEPEPLYSVLRERGFEYESRRVDADEWHVTVTHSGNSGG
jgi:uncharacterized protein (DUF2249 family)